MQRRYLVNVVIVAGLQLSGSAAWGLPIRDRLLAVTVAALWGANFLAIHFALDGFPPLLLAALRYVVIAVPVLPPLPLLALFLPLEGPGAVVDAVRGLASGPWTVPVGFGYLVIFGTVVGGALWTGLIRRYDAGVVAPYSLLVPVVGMTLAWLVLGERRSAVELGAAVVVVAGVLLGTPRNRTRPVAAPPPAVAAALTQRSNCA